MLIVIPDRGTTSWLMVVGGRAGVVSARDRDMAVFKLLIKAVALILA